MGFGHKKPHMQPNWIKENGAYDGTTWTVKASDIALASAPVVAFGGPEAVAYCRSIRSRRTSRQKSIWSCFQDCLILRMDL
jgi:hypothetical protein